MVWVIMTISEYKKLMVDYSELNKEMRKMQDFLKKANLKMEINIEKQEDSLEKLKKEAKSDE